MANMADATGVSLMAAKSSFTRGINYAATMIRDFHIEIAIIYSAITNYLIECVTYSLWRIVYINSSLHNGN